MNCNKVLSNKPNKDTMREHKKNTEYIGNRAKPLTLENVQKFYEWMTSKDKKPLNEKGVLTKSLGISKSKAVSIIYALQEEYGIIDDYFECCKDCKEYFDSSEEGISSDMDLKDYGYSRNPRKHESGNYCDDCARNRFD
jgi:hypothetical protein